jgi:hypothetical protein
MQQFFTTQLAQPRSVSTEPERTNHTPEFALLGVLVACALGCCLHKRYRLLLLRHHTQTLERIWQLETTKKTR